MGLGMIFGVIVATMLWLILVTAFDGASREFVAILQIFGLSIFLGGLIGFISPKHCMDIFFAVVKGVIGVEVPPSDPLNYEYGKQKIKKSRHP